MSFSYAVPLSTFNELFTATDSKRHPELIERLRTEIHADLARRMTGPDIATPMGWLRTAFDSSVVHGDIVFYSMLDFHDAVETTGSPQYALRRPMFPLPGLKEKPQAQLLLKLRGWRYPGGGGDGIFAQSVNTVLARSDKLVEEYRS